MTSPTARTLDWLRKAGYLAQVVERWNPHAKVRKDLFDVIDVVAVGGGKTGCLGVQACAGASHAARRDKIAASEKAQAWIAAGNRLWVMSWAKRGPRGKRKVWEPRIEEITVNCSFSPLGV